MKKLAIVGVLLALIAAVLTACSNSQPESGGAAGTASDTPLVKAAKKEGSVRWYSGENPVFTGRVSDAFEKRYGIKVEWTRAVAGDLQQRYSTEQKAGTPSADVMNTGTQAFYADGQKEGWFVSLADQDIPSLKAWPKNYTYAASAVISITPFTLGYNTDLVKPDQVPNTWQDLLKPENRGRIMLLDPRAAPAYLGQVQMFNKKLGAEFVRDLGSARPTLIQSSVPGAQALGAGEKAFLFPTLGDFMDPLMKKGAPIKLKILDPTTGVEQNMAISTKAAHPSAARLFLDWILSKEGQDVMIDEYKVSPARVKDAKNLPPNYVSPGDVTYTPAQREQLLQMLNLR